MMTFLTKFDIIVVDNQPLRHPKLGDVEAYHLDSVRGHAGVEKVEIQIQEGIRDLETNVNQGGLELLLTETGIHEQGSNHDWHKNNSQIFGVSDLRS